MASLLCLHRLVSGEWIKDILTEAGEDGRDAEEKKLHIRDRSCLLRCSLRLKARLQNWHLYFLSGASEVFLVAGVDAAEDGMTATLAPGILNRIVAVCRLSGDPISCSGD